MARVDINQRKGQNKMKKIIASLVAMAMLGVVGTIIYTPSTNDQTSTPSTTLSVESFLASLSPASCEAQGCVPCPDGEEGGPGCCGWESGCHWSYYSCFGYYVNVTVPCGGTHCDFVFGGYGAPCRYECVSCTNC